MRTRASVQWLSLALTAALLAGCSNGSAIAPSTSKTQSHVHAIGHGLSVVNPVVLLRLSQRPITPHYVASYDACPAKGPIEYISDFTNNAVDIFAGKNFTPGETPCGAITGFDEPQGLTVNKHELYVANTADADILRFPRGSTSPDKTYVDPTCGGQFPADVAVAPDGTVIATDFFSGGCLGGLSTWTNDGTFVGYFTNVNGANDYFVTVQKNGNVFFDDNTFMIYVGRCPAGACGTFTATGATMAFPGGLNSASGPKSEDLVLDDQSAPGGGALTTFESFPSPSWSCPLGAGDPVSYGFNRTDHHAFYADALNDVAGEVRWNDSSNTCPTVTTISIPGMGIGVAVDAPGPD
jgi:hypothetical protein